MSQKKKMSPPIRIPTIKTILVVEEDGPHPNQIFVLLKDSLIDGVNEDDRISTVRNYVDVDSLPDQLMKMVRSFLRGKVWEPTSVEEAEELMAKFAGGKQ